MCVAYWLIPVCLCQEFIDNLGLPASSDMMDEETSTDDVWELVLPN